MNLDAWRTWRLDTAPGEAARTMTATSVLAILLGFLLVEPLLPLSIGVACPTTSGTFG